MPDVSDAMGTNTVYYYDHKIHYNSRMIPSNSNTVIRQIGSHIYRIKFK